MKHPFDVFPNDKFISVVIPSFNRPEYLEKALQSLEEFSDTYYEAIIHDDGSVKNLKDMIYSICKKGASSVIFNNGVNAGLIESANRMMKIASSKYILFMADDCFFVSPCLKGICETLSKEYVGIVSPFDGSDHLDDATVCKNSDTRFCLTNGLGGGAAVAFRKDVYSRVGGFDIRSVSSQSDNVFIFKILKAGYWKAIIEGPQKVLLGNYFYGDKYVPTEAMMNSRDCSLPKIFGISQTALDIMSAFRKESCYYWTDGERTIVNRETFDGRPNPVAGLNDIPYWGNYFIDIFGGKNSSDVREILWEVAARHGQANWRNDIEKDFGIK